MSRRRMGRGVAALIPDRLPSRSDPGRRLVMSWSQSCEQGEHRCNARLFLGGRDQELLICPCSCHDVGETKPDTTSTHREFLGGTAADIISAWASRLGRIGGKRGGLARAAMLTPQQRRAHARRAARARWGKR